MEITRQELKNTAKEILREKYWQLFVVALLFHIATSTISFFVTGFLVTILVSNPLMVAYSKFLKRNSENEGVSYSVLSETIKSNYRNILKTTFMRDLIITLWGLPAMFGMYMIMVAMLCLPQISSAVPELGILRNIPENVVLSMAIVGGVVTVAGFLIVIYKSYDYLMVNYIVGDNPGKDWRTVFSESKNLIKDKKKFVFILDLSFIGWYLLCGVAISLVATLAGVFALILFMIGAILVDVYRSMTITQLYIHLSGENSVDSEEKDFPYNITEEN